MDNLKPRHIAGLVIAWIMIKFHVIFILLGLLVIGIVLYDMFKKTDKKIEEEPKDERLQINDTSYEQVRLVAEIAEEELSKRNEIKKQTDTRQFNGRTDVTKEEVLEYMLNKDTYVGFVKQQIHLERIMEVCNINESDRIWITHELWGKTKVFEDVEGLAFEKYMNEKQKQSTIRIEEGTKKYWNELANMKIYTKEEARKNMENELAENEHRRRHYMYDEWLKEKGYI